MRQSPESQSSGALQWEPSGAASGGVQRPSSHRDVPQHSLESPQPMTQAPSSQIEPQGQSALSLQECVQLPSWQTKGRSSARGSRRSLQASSELQTQRPERSSQERPSPHSPSLWQRGVQTPRAGSRPCSSQNIPGGQPSSATSQASTQEGTTPPWYGTSLQILPAPHEPSSPQGSGAGPGSLGPGVPGALGPSHPRRRGAPPLSAAVMPKRIRTLLPPSGRDKF